jgi:hypothetical protein
MSIREKIMKTSMNTIVDEFSDVLSEYNSDYKRRITEWHGY